MYYIRFLKTPKLVQDESGRPCMNCVLTIVTDLGEACYPYNVTLEAHVNHATKQNVLAASDLEWTPGLRALPVTIPLAPSYNRFPFSVDISSKDESVRDYRAFDGLIIMPMIVSVVSSPVFVNKSILEAQKLALRNIALSNGQSVSVWEDTGNSIAHHIWDAGMALVAYLDLTLNPQLSKSRAGQAISAIELGTGCGLVGLALMKLIPECNVLLTDVDEVEEFITKHNIKSDAGNISYCNLDWSDELPETAAQRHFDLILVADCIYNPDSSPDLVKTINTLEKLSTGAKILLASKTRHPSEAVFFDLMKQNNFDITETTVVLAPNDPDDIKLQEGEKIHIYSYARNPL